MRCNWAHSPLVLDGVPYILVPTVLAVLSGLWLGFFWAIPFILLTGFGVWFFRNPSRRISHNDKAILSPADGTVVKVERVSWDPLLGGASTRVSIFMSLFNVHVNRIPVAGTVESVHYYRGTFLPAMKNEASAGNERNVIVLQGAQGSKTVFTQVAGIFARRIVCCVREGDRLDQGQIYGAVLFGSRVDMSIPSEISVTVRVGDRVTGGTSVLGVIS